MSKPIGEETAAPIPYANIDGRRVAVLHGRVAKTPDGRIHEIVQPATMMHEQEPVPKRYGVHCGNAAKLREALEELMANIEMRSSAFGLNVIVDTKTFLDAKAALSAPPRNCDVGTAKEQAVRKAEYCVRYAPFADSNCDACPLRNYNRAQPERMVGYSCDLAWGQLPYEAAQKGGE